MYLPLTNAQPAYLAFRWLLHCETRVSHLLSGPNKILDHSIHTDAGHNVTVFDRAQYDANGYDPAADDVQAASVDHNKIVRVQNHRTMNHITEQTKPVSRLVWNKAALPTPGHGEPRRLDP